MSREEEWYEMLHDEHKRTVKSKDQSIEDSAFKILFELSPDHLAAVSYLIQNCVRRDGVNEDTHWAHIHTAVDLIKMGEQAFRNQK